MEPERPQYPAARATAQQSPITLGLHAPITELPFDVEWDDVADGREMKAEEVAYIPFMASFGRPL